MNSELKHIPVLCQEIMGYLKLNQGDTVFDATLGGGGHAGEILKKIIPEGILIAVDRDIEAIERVKFGLKQYEGSIIYANDSFRNIDQILRRERITELDSAVFDLGMSSFQIDDAERGFSFLKDGPLDMRFDKSQELSAVEVVNKFGMEKLADIIKEYGEERHAKLIASAVAVARKKKRISTTGELKEVIYQAVGRKYSRQKLNPAARTFQALRIYVNDELEAIEDAVAKTISYLKPNGRICVISFHSLEDRIVKNIFRNKQREKEISVITKKPIYPSREEIAVNHRSRSAKLRVAEKL
ncbi:MAG: 16S rRNA (cytosine(1402)-N(4))-methyltransferase RsmH [Candidatus Omnitrophota bacterium]